MGYFYLIGSLRNPEVPKIAAKLRTAGFDIFDDWYAAGEIADDSWRDYEIARGRTYQQALDGHAAKHVFEFDLKHLTAAHGAILALPAGKSSHLELGWMLGKGKRGFVLLDTPERWDVMYQFATGVYATVEELIVGMEMPYVQKKGEAPQIVKSAYPPLSASERRIGFPMCLSCGRQQIPGQDHTRCRGAA